MSKTKQFIKSGKYVKRVRKQVGLTQAEFGERVGLTKSNVCRYENDGLNITLFRFLQICQEFDVTNFDEIFND